MKIKWLIEDRVSPAVGLLLKGEVKDVERDIGLAFIRQGEAEAVDEIVINPHNSRLGVKTKVPGGGE